MKLLITLLILLLPLLISLMEQRSKKARAKEAMRKVRQRQDQPPQKAAKPSQSLADWIEELSQKQDITGNMDPAAPGRRKRVVDPMDEPALDREWDIENEDEYLEEDVLVEAPPLPRNKDESPQSLSKARLFQETAAEAIAREEVTRQTTLSDTASSAPRAVAARRARRAARVERVYKHSSMGPDDLRQAVILKEILDRPVAMRRRGRTARS